MDSMVELGISVETVLQLAKIYSIPTNHSYLKVKRLSVQQQHGVYDCGLFSIANLVEVRVGKNPEESNFNPHQWHTITISWLIFGCDTKASAWCSYY